MDKLQVRDLLAGRPKQVFAVGPDATVYQALEIMAEHDIGAVMVIDETGKLHGVFSERDHARRDMIKGRDAAITRVKEVMSSRVVVVRPDTRVHDCMGLMIEKKVRHLPVVENDEVVGVVSMRDVVQEYISQQEHVISQQSFHIHELEEYMSVRPR